MARTTEHFIWTGDYADRLSSIQQQAEQAARDETPLLGGETDPLVTLGEQYDELKAEADAAGLRVVLRGLRDDEWDDFVEAHPPRTDPQFADSDKHMGYNERTGTRAFVMAAMVEPAFDLRTKFDDWVREHGLTRGDLNAMALKAWALTNGMGAADPKSLPPLPTRSADDS